MEFLATIGHWFGIPILLFGSFMYGRYCSTDRAKHLREQQRRMASFNRVMKTMRERR